jgi:hypothetical protein
MFVHSKAPVGHASFASTIDTGVNGTFRGHVEAFSGLADGHQVSVSDGTVTC